jgi:hypothetical protein
VQFSVPRLVHQCAFRRRWTAANDLQPRRKYARLDPGAIPSRQFLAYPPGSPGRPRRRNRPASTPPPTGSRQRSRSLHRRRQAAVVYWRLTALTPRAIQDRCPGSHRFHARLRTIPPGVTTWPSEHNTSPTSPARFETSQSEPAISQSGLGREATRAPHSSAT